MEGLCTMLCALLDGDAQRHELNARGQQRVRHCVCPFSANARRPCAARLRRSCARARAPAVRPGPTGAARGQTASRRPLPDEAPRQALACRAAVNGPSCTLAPGRYLTDGARAGAAEPATSAGATTSRPSGLTERAGDLEDELAWRSARARAHREPGRTFKGGPSPSPLRRGPCVPPRAPLRNADERVPRRARRRAAGTGLTPRRRARWQAACSIAVRCWCMRSCSRWLCCLLAHRSAAARCVPPSRHPPPSPPAVRRPSFSHSSRASRTP